MTGSDVHYGDQDVAMVQIMPTTEDIGLVLLDSRFRGGSGWSCSPGCYRMRTPLYAASATGQARVLVVGDWVDRRVRPLYPGLVPPSAGPVLAGVVGDVPVSRQYVALVCRAWGNDLRWAATMVDGVRYVAAWTPGAGVPVAALAPLGRVAARVRVSA